MCEGSWLHTLSLIVSPAARTRLRETLIVLSERVHTGVYTVYRLPPCARTLQFADHAGNELLVVRSTSVNNVWVALGCVVARALENNQQLNNVYWN